MNMKTLAAILVETGKPLEVAEIGIPDLKPGQVLVEIAYSGICHTQILECRGYRGEDAYLPHCLGHEGSGIVQQVGAGVAKCKSGDHAILSWIKGSGADVPGTVYDWNGRKVNAGGVTTFSRHAIVSENRITVIPEDYPLAQAALIGCAVPTGVGAVLNTASPRPAESLVVFGTGGIGLCSIAAASMIGVMPLVAVDISPERLELAKQVGATHCLDAASENLPDAIRAICPGGADFAIEATGCPEVMAMALSVVRAQGGTAVVVGNAHHGRQLTFDPHQLNQGKRLLGTWGGDNQPDRDFPRYLQLLEAGKLNVGPLLGKEYTLAQINEAIDDLEAKRVGRPLVKMED